MGTLTRKINACRIAVLLSALSAGSLAHAQVSSLNLASGSVVRGGSIALSLSLSVSGSSAPAGLQWTLSYPPGDFSSFGIAAGPALTTAAKTLTCVPGTGAVTCLAAGVNSNTIGSGVVATVTAATTPLPIVFE